jgi:hypothetical protein
MSWLPILMIENAQQSRQTGAAVESFRNEMVESNTQNLKHLKEQLDYANIADPRLR